MTKIEATATDRDALTQMTISELLEVHNGLAEQHGGDALQSWKRAKSELVDRTVALGAVPADETAPEVAEEADTLDHEADGAPEQEPSVDDKIRNAKVTGPARLGTIGELVHELLMDVDNAYVEIVAEVKRRFPDAKTTARSVASVAATLRKKGVDVPTRRKAAEG